MTIDERIEQEIKRNPELAKVFKEHPERKEMYKQKILESENETWGCRRINPKWCQTCRFAHGKPPFEDLPNKAYCMIYSKDDSNGKPPEVYYDGEECDFYEKG